MDGLIKKGTNTGAALKKNSRLCRKRALSNEKKTKDKKSYYSGDIFTFPYTHFLFFA